MHAHTGRIAFVFCAATLGCSASNDALDDSGGTSSGGATTHTGGASASAGAGQAGTTAAGGSAGSATAGAAGTALGGSTTGGVSSAGSANGGSGGFVAPQCADGAGALPDDAPALTPGTWVPINPSQVVYGNTEVDVFTQGLALDPCNPATIYLTACANPVDDTRNPGLYRTTNAGTSWTKLGPFDGPINIRIDPKDPLHLYANQGVRGSAIGFWVSTDGGENWEQPQGFLDAAATVNDTDVYHVEPDPADFNHVLLSFHYYWYGGGTMGVFESTDGGDTFIVHDPVPGLEGAGGYGIFMLHNPALGIGDGKTWLLGTQGAGYYRTTDAGENWTKVTENSMDHGGGQIYYTKEGVLFAAGVPNLMKSTDNGATWQTGGNPNKLNWGYLGLIGDGTHLYTSAHDHDGEFQTSLESDGLNWTDFNAQISHAGSFEMAYDSVNGIVYSANEYDGLLALKVSP